MRNCAALEWLLCKRSRSGNLIQCLYPVCVDFRQIAPFQHSLCCMARATPPLSPAGARRYRLTVNLESAYTSRKTVFYDNFVSFWTCHSKHIASIWTSHSEHSCHIGPFSCYIGHFLSFWIGSPKTMFSTGARDCSRKSLMPTLPPVAAPRSGVKWCTLRPYPRNSESLSSLLDSAS